MFDSIINFFKKFSKENKDSKDTAKERLHLVLMQDRANVSADFLEMMKQEIIEVIKKYIDVDENSIDVKLTNKVNSDGTTGAPALYANIPITSLKDETKKVTIERKKEANNENEKTENEKTKQGEVVTAQKESKNEISTESNENEEVIDKCEQNEIIKHNKSNELEDKQDRETEDKQEENDLSQSDKSENKQEENNKIENKETKSEEPKEEKKEE